jgi:carbonic anhydrase
MQRARLAASSHPIDLTATVRARQPPLRINWGKRPNTIINNGHTIQLEKATRSTWATANMC